jgi:hypothetical protein
MFVTDSGGTVTCGINQFTQNEWMVVIWWIDRGADKIGSRCYGQSTGLIGTITQTVISTAFSGDKDFGNTGFFTVGDPGGTINTPKTIAAFYYGYGASAAAGLAANPDAAVTNLFNYLIGKGPVGPAGPQGPLGPPIFLVGEDGDQGYDGPPGKTGTAGTTGAQGPTGPAVFLEAEPGDDGALGPPGQPGINGVTGSQGPIGPAVFLEAEPGDDGMPGQPGTNGINGTTGSIGPAGPAIFLVGEDGQDGDMGPVGPTGTSTGSVVGDLALNKHIPANFVVTAGTSAYVSRYIEIAAGVTIEVGADGDLEIG